MYTHVYMYVYAYVYMYVCVYACMCTYAYIYIYVYTHIVVYEHSIMLGQHLITYTPNLPTNVTPTNIARLRLSGKSPMDMRIPPC